MGFFAEKYGYGLGKHYPTVAPSDPSEYLDAVKRGERTIATRQRNGYDGIYWLGTDTSVVDYTLYRGITGLAYFYLKLYTVTNDEYYGDLVRGSLRYLVKHWRTLAETPNNEWLSHRERGLYGGIAGLGAVLLEAWRTLGDDVYRNTVTDILQWYVDHAERDAHGVYWSGNVAIMLDTGATLFLIDAYDKLQLDDDALRRTIIDAGNRILSTGLDDGKGGVWFDIFDGIEDFIEPGFELGSAGVGFLLVRLYDFTADQRYLDAAKRVDAYLERLYVPQTKGALLPYRFDRNGNPLTENGEVVYYLGICHGPAGTARFYYALAQVTGDEAYREKVVRLVDGLEAQGAPEHQTTGLWNSVNYCCGHAGLVHFFIGLYAADHNERWLDLAKRSAAVILGQEEILPNGSSDWPLAFTRIEPDVYSRPVTYYDGIAGITASLLEVYAVETHQERWLRIADDPFPERLS